MAAIVTEIVMQIPIATIFYDTYHIEIHITRKYTDWVIRPVDIVVQSWLRYHLNLVNTIDFVWALVYPFIKNYINE